MSKTMSINSNHPLVGDWKPADDFSEVIVSIVAEANGFKVSIIDQADGEMAEVFESKFDGDTLSFRAHWPTNGRFIHYKFLLQSKDTINVTYTYSGQEIWQRS